MQLTSQYTGTYAVRVRVGDSGILNTQITECSAGATAAEASLPAVIHRNLQITYDMSLSVKLATEMAGIGQITE